MSAHLTIPRPQPSVLEDFISRAELARMLHRTVRTLSRWEVERCGPPVTRFGDSIYYRRSSVMAWLERREHRVETPRNPGFGRRR
jgi:hypothetical protein